MNASTPTSVTDLKLLYCNLHINYLTNFTNGKSSTERRSMPIAMHALTFSLLVPVLRLSQKPGQNNNDFMKPE